MNISLYQYEMGIWPVTDKIPHRFLSRRTVPKHLQTPGLSSVQSRNLQSFSKHNYVFELYTEKPTWKDRDQSKFSNARYKRTKIYFNYISVLGD